MKLLALLLLAGCSVGPALSNAADSYTTDGAVARYWGSPCHTADGYRACFELACAAGGWCEPTGQGGSWDGVCVLPCPCPTDVAGKEGVCGAMTGGSDACWVTSDVERR